MARKYNQHIRDTAKAWHLGLYETKRIHQWVGTNIPPERRGTVFTTLLRRHYVKTEESHSRTSRTTN